MTDEVYKKHSPTKVSATLKSPTPKIAKAVLDKIASLGHPVPKEILETSQAVQATLKGKPVLAFPMHTGSKHCINYTQYPAEPRFLNCSKTLGIDAELGLLNKPAGDGDFLIKPLLLETHPNHVFLLEGVWDMLDFARLFPTWALPGVNNFQDSMLPLFEGKDVFILFDNDDPGDEWSQRVARKLANHAKSVRILTLPPIVNQVAINDVGDLMAIKDFNDQDVITFINGLIDNAVTPEFNVLEEINKVIDFVYKYFIC